VAAQTSKVSLALTVSFVQRWLHYEQVFPRRREVYAFDLAQSIRQKYDYFAIFFPSRACSVLGMEVHSIQLVISAITRLY
jgi:hypothetical protein